MNTTEKDLEKRVFRLETQNKFLTAGIFLAMMIMLSAAAIPNSPRSVPDEVQARAFTLIDSTGNKRAHFVQ